MGSHETLCIFCFFGVGGPRGKGGGGAGGEAAGSTGASETKKNKKYTVFRGSPYQTNKNQKCTVFRGTEGANHCVFLVFLVWEAQRGVLGGRPRGAPGPPKPKQPKKQKYTVFRCSPYKKEPNKTNIHSVSWHRGRQTLCIFGFSGLGGAEKGAGREARAGVGAC